MRFSIVLYFFVEGLFYKLAIFGNAYLDLPVFSLFGLDPLDGVVHQVNSHGDNVIVWHG